ncbi:MAG TPA: SPOR domain-containing protein [Bacteroidota bacterium]|nr:SPOR domain-containing protein [Bacteroidota bacterium]
MPNLNLKNDAPEDEPEMSEVSELDEESPSVAGSSLIKALPLVTGGLIAILLSVYILNKVGIVHFWGPNKASSVMVAVPVDSATQVLSDSVMAAQFKKDSADAVHAAVAAKQPSAAQSRAEIKKAAAEKQAAEKKQAELKLAEKKEAARKLAEQKQADAKKAAEAKKLEQKAAADNAKRAAEERAIARKQEEARAAAARKNATTIEVQGVQRGRASEPAVQERAQTRRATESAAAQAEPKAEKKTRVAAEKPAVAASVKAAKKPARETDRAVRVASTAPATKEAKTAGADQVYTVQLSSWMSAAKAQSLVSKFKSAGVPAFVYTEGHVHRVCTGRFATQEAATARAEELVPMLETKYDIITLK